MSIDNSHRFNILKRHNLQLTNDDIADFMETLQSPELNILQTARLLDSQPSVEKALLLSIFWYSSLHFPPNIPCLYISRYIKHCFSIGNGQRLHQTMNW